MLFNTLLLFCYAYVCLAANNYDIIWDRNYCAEKDRYPSSYKLPHNSPCSLCIDDVITFRINSTANIYENLFRVPSETAMMNCDANINNNTNVYAFNDKQEITIRAGGSEPAFSFLFRAEPYYFISTSDGTQTSAENDLSRSPNTCLQFTFTVRLSNDQSCGTYAANCIFTTVFTDTLSCSAITTTTPDTTSATTVSNTISTTTATSSNPNTVGLSLVFSIDTTDSPEFIIFISVLLVFTSILLILCSAFGTIFLTLYWFNKIPYLFICCRKISCPTFNHRKKREVELAKKSYQPEIGLISISAPQPQSSSFGQDSHYENWEPKNH